MCAHVCVQVGRQLSSSLKFWLKLVTNMPDNIKSLKKCNQELKKQLEAARGDLKSLQDRVFAQERVDSSNANGGPSCNLTVEAEKSLQFLGQEYDDLHNSEMETKAELSRIGSELTKLYDKFEELDKALEELQEYSYVFNAKILGVPELSSMESAEDTSNLCLRLFNAMGAHVTLNDIDIAHRVTTRDSSRVGPKPIVCKFTRRLARNRVMAVRKEACKINPTDIGLSEEDDMPSARVVDHLTPRKHKLYADAKAFQQRYGYEFCWTKNATIFLRQTAESRPIKVRNASHLGNLAQQEQGSLI